MLKKSLILIALFIVIASISTRAESLQELINRKKIEAIAKVKPIVQKMINDSIEVYKQHSLWQDDYKDAENFHYIYFADLDYNDKAFYFDDSTSVNSVIDTTQVLFARIHVIDKQHNEVIQLYINENEVDVGCFYLTNPPKKSELRYCYYYDVEQDAMKQFGEIPPFISLPSFRVLPLIIYQNKIYIQKFGDTILTDFDKYVKFEYPDNRNLYCIKYEGICKQITKLSNNLTYLPKVKRDFSSSIQRLNRILDSLDEKHIKPLRTNKKENFYKKCINDSYTFPKLIEKVYQLGLSLDEFERDSNKLSFRSEYFFKSDRRLRDFQIGETILDSLNCNYSRWSNINYNIYWNGKIIGCKNGGLINFFDDFSDSEYAPQMKTNIEYYDWIIDTECGFLIKSNNELYRVFVYNNFISSPIPYQQFLEEIIDEYSIRKLSGK